jgi:hypothetical protein
MQPNKNCQDNSIYTRLRTELYNNGLFEQEADAILSSLVSQQDHPMFARWNDTATGYPAEMLGLLWMDAKASALEWIDKNKPLHWARPMFTPDVEGTIEKLEASNTDPRIKPIADRLRAAKQLFLDTHRQSPKDELVATRAVRRHQTAFDKLDLTKK